MVKVGVCFWSTVFCRDDSSDTFQLPEWKMKVTLGVRKPMKLVKLESVSEKFESPNNINNKVRNYEQYFLDLGSLFGFWREHLSKDNFLSPLPILEWSCTNSGRVGLSLFLISDNYNGTHHTLSNKKWQKSPRIRTRSGFLAEWAAPKPEYSGFIVRNPISECWNWNKNWLYL